MAKSRDQKQQELSRLTDRFGRMKVAVFTTTGGLKVKDVTDLRNQLRKEGIDYTVAKKTLVNRALKDAKVESVDVSGIMTSFSIAFGYEDEISPAKFLAQFAKTHESVQFLGGILNGVFVDADQMKALSKLPTRDELRARVVGSMAAPLSGFVNVLAGNLRGLVRVLDAVRNQKATVSS